MIKKILYPVLFVLLTACASSSPRIIIDEQATDMTNYSRDLAECQAYADQVPVGTEVAKGTVGGAVVGGTLGAIVGNSRTAKKGAGVGAVGGAVRSNNKAGNEKERVVKNCLRNRGYKVLN